MATYRLSASLEGHDDDVRGVVFPQPGTVLSASRDATVRIWMLSSPHPPTFDTTISSQGSAFINALTFIPPSSRYSQGLVISGGKDTIIEVRQPGTPPDGNAEALLIGHSHNICALDVDSTGQWIVSGSWDGTARLWRVDKWNCEVVFEGHQGSVWAVMFWDENTIVTGCADQFIRVFRRDGTLVRTIRGNTEVIRALCRVPANHPSGAQIASASNDGVIRLWSLHGHQLGELRGHDSFIYSLASLPSGELISSGEDRTLKVWQGTNCVQTITHPAISVWCVAACADNGDIVSGASDRIVRIFTRDEERQAAPEVLQALEESVKSSSIPQQQVGDINKEKLPGPEFLQQKRGTKEGQVVMIREGNGNVTAHQWSTATQQWISVGTVVDAVGSSGRKQEYLGEDYDYVFDVDIKEGAPPLKLPYNLSENPYEAATKFLHENELPISYLDQVADFITTNTRGATIGQSQQETQTPGPDPFGTENRYRPGDGSSQQPAPSSSSPPPKPKPKKLPQTTYLSIKQANLQTIQKKIEELNQQLVANGNKDLSLNPSDINVLKELVSYLEMTPATARSQSSAMVNAGVNLVLRIIMLWPPAQRLPGLDVLRLVAAETAALATYRSASDESVVDLLDRSGVFEDTERGNHIMLAVRTFVNLFETAEGRDLAKAKFEQIHALTSHLPSNPILSSNRNLLISYTTLLINFSVLFSHLSSSSSSISTATIPSDQQHQQQQQPLMHTVRTILKSLHVILNTATDSEVLYRSLVATGTLLHVANPETRKWALWSSSTLSTSAGNGNDDLDDDAGGELGLLTQARAIANKVQEPRIREVVGEIEEVAAAAAAASAR